MKITVCGSMHYKYEMVEAAKRLRTLGYETEIPDLNEGHSYEGKSRAQKANDKEGFIRNHLNKINTSDAILVFNREKNGVANYIGGNTLMEMAFAYAQGIEIFLLNPAPDLSYASEIEGMQPIILNDSVEAVDHYFKGLPKTFVSSNSPIKLLAVSRGMRRAGIRTQLIAKPTTSGVAEQPLSVEETYDGAKNRHASLQQQTKNQPLTYRATVESGLATIHPDHNSFEAIVVILEKVGVTQKTGIAIELEYPKKMTDKIPSQYPDLGVLVQQEYGSALKDPFPYFTNNKINRIHLVENAVFNVAVQFTEEKV